VSADIEERTKREIFAAEYDHIVATNIASKVVAYIRDIVYVPYELPSLQE
jgi:hypothetical protein